MAVIKLVENYSVAQLRKDVRDSLMMAGEQAILLQTYHPGDEDAVRCPQCGDDIYDSPEKDCQSCYGTLYVGGIRHAMKIWAMFTDHQVNEQLGPRGTYEPDHRSVQFEALPLVTEHDYIVRVRQWQDGKPLVIEGFYMLQAVDRRSLRTGNRFGQYAWDVVGQKAQVSEVPQRDTGLTTYPIVGLDFPEMNVQTSPKYMTADSAAPVIEPHDSVYFPFSPGGSGQ